jgi:hypothetical protein
MACVCILRIHDAGFSPRRGINSQASAPRAARCCDQKGLRTDDTGSPTKQSFPNKNRHHHLWRLRLPAVTLQGQSTKADPTRMCDALIPSSFPHPNRAHKEVGQWWSGWWFPDEHQYNRPRRTFRGKMGQMELWRWCIAVWTKLRISFRTGFHLNAATRMSSRISWHTAQPWRLIAFSHTSLLTRTTERTLKTSHGNLNWTARQIFARRE